MLDKKYVENKIKEIRQAFTNCTMYTNYDIYMECTDKLLDKILVGVYDCGYEDGMSDADVDHDECHEPIYNEGYD